MDQITLNTVDAVIDALGGTTAVSRLTGQGVASVSNWRFRKRIPAEHFLTFYAALEAEGMTADPIVFGMKEQAA